MFAKTGKQRSGFYFADGGGDVCVRIGEGFFFFFWRGLKVYLVLSQLE